jgi:tmRNA-binding protein
LNKKEIKELERRVTVLENQLINLSMELENQLINLSMEVAKLKQEEKPTYLA